MLPRRKAVLKGHRKMLQSGGAEADCYRCELVLNCYIAKVIFVLPPLSPATAAFQTLISKYKRNQQGMGTANGAHSQEMEQRRVCVTTSLETSA